MIIMKLVKGLNVSIFKNYALKSLSHVMTWFF